MEYIIKEKDEPLIKALIKEVGEINKKLESLHIDNKLYIDIQTYHDQYSPERTDPCPDYYGYYKIISSKFPNEKIGDFMTIEELDNAIFLLHSFVDQILDKN